MGCDRKHWSENMVFEYHVFRSPCRRGAPGTPWRLRPPFPISIEQQRSVWELTPVAWARPGHPTMGKHGLWKTWFSKNMG